MKKMVIFIGSFLFAFVLKPGDYVTANVFNENSVNWAKKFKIAEIGGIDDKKIKPWMLNEFKNTIILGYDWMPAIMKYFYSNSPYYELIKPQYILNPNGPFI
ncbi:MAG: hypothetical protein GXO49_06920, partial [Chlorobi bacterium]|nr:hypothetical protein [Chlorobiota bacterium]